MKHKLAAIGLAPLLILQGLYVRRVTPKLPEPLGKRSGVHGTGPRLRLLILGDSAAAGVGVSTQSQAYQVNWSMSLVQISRCPGS